METTGSEKDDYTCPICMYILIHPVTMPCNHSLCMPCYKQCVEKTTLTCPLCRMRISSWARKHSRLNTLVDAEKWDVIQRTFPVQVKNRLEDKESSDDEWESLHHIETELRKRKEVSKPGAIRQEYEAALAQLHKQQEEEKRKEEEASALLIRALQEEEEAEIAELEKERESNERKGIEAAKELNRQENATVLWSTSCNIKASGTGAKKKSSNKPKRCDPSLKLDSFYETIRRTSCSAPVICKVAPSPSLAETTLSPQDRHKRELSPYPYICISPSDKAQEIASSSGGSSPEWNSHLEPHLAEHSYTTLSARRIDLTSSSEFYMSCRRCDIPSNPLPVVKLEALDGSVSPQNFEESSSSFQPIESFIRTPPRKLPSGQSIEPSLVRAVPRNLCFEDHQSRSSSSLRAGSADKQVGSNCKLSMSHLQAPDESAKVFSSRFVDKETEGEVVSYFNKDRKLKERNVSETVSSSSSAASFSGTAVSNAAHNIPTELEMEDIADSADNKFITADTPLLIPLEPDLSVCNIENEFQSLLPTSQTAASEKRELTVKNAVREKHKLPEANDGVNSRLQDNNNDRSFSLKVLSPKKAPTSKGKTLLKTLATQSMSSSSKVKKSQINSNMSIREFCVPTNVSINTLNSRKRKPSDELDNGSFVFETAKACDAIDGSLCDNRHAQEEADRIYAMQLQNMYNTLDKHRIQVERYKGSKDEYSFRKRRCL